MKSKQSYTLTEGDLQSLSELMGGLLDRQTALLATKEELREGLSSQTTELKVYIHEGIETVMEGMDALEKRLDVRDRVEILERDVKELKLNPR